jgi:hypothetical protein
MNSDAFTSNFHHSKELESGLGMKHYVFSLHLLSYFPGYHCPIMLMDRVRE